MDDQIVRETMAKAINMKRHQWHDHGERDMMPEVLVVSHGETYPIPGPVMAFAVAAKGGLYEGLYWLLVERTSDGKALLDIIDHQVDFVILSADMYADVRDKGSALPSPGDLEASFKNDPSTTVKECLRVMFAKDDLVGGVEIIDMATPYALTDGGSLVFDDPIVVEGDAVISNLGDLLRKMVLKGFQS